MVDPKRLIGLMQHVAERVAGLLDVVSIIHTTTNPGARESTRPIAPPPRGGVPQNIGASDSTGSKKGTQRATPALRRDATQQLTKNDRVATLAVLESIPHGTRIYFNLTDTFCDEKLIHFGSILDTHRNTEVVLGIVSLDPVGACFGTVGADAIPFQQDLPGEVRTFQIPCNE
eukprot:12620581-Heterocapsa_arctica.AAC.1